VSFRWLGESSPKPRKPDGGHDKICHGSPRLENELPTLWRTLGMFAALTGAAALSFYGQLRMTGWRWAPIVVLLLGIAAVGWILWPR
jgi:hypothetical protein